VPLKIETNMMKNATRLPNRQAPAYEAVTIELSARCYDCARDGRWKFDGHETILGK